jgi:hypothetical protein
MSNRIQAANSQSTFDIALQTIGTIEGMVQLLVDNKIESVDYDFLGGEIIEFEDATNAQGRNYKANGYVFVTGEPKIQDFGSYNNDYNIDYKK